LHTVLYGESEAVALIESKLLDFFKPFGNRDAFKRLAAAERFPKRCSFAYDVAFNNGFF
jgi:hypothetical protein